ncbi:alpha-aminoadipic semialdehyde synthase [Selaginella moellendorffii]|uniref:alpha-aminoadipic semialdehyde synthase n=1 Tax=Selaginella moellendorffii TaxID=88036 RepID=UPI000D1CA990|nr:alpha-aminoadipic semialdehyde synthase [Selaginella moellendorffii]|eukprot:XP_002975543.2 alpha-aminoadipic semialdehyde synthase [Selaginella moellendorffii]
MALGNGVLGVLKEEKNKWERRAPLTPTLCGRLLRSGAVERIIVQPCSKRIHRDYEYEDAGCEVSEDLSQCGLILGVKQPKLGTLLEDRAYGFFSHTHKAQPQNMPLLDEVLGKRVLLYDYELIVDDHGKRLVAFGEYAGRAGMIDFFRGLGERLLSLGYSTPFVSLGSSYMYMSLSAAKAAVLMVGDAISSSGLPQELCPLVFVFTGSGNVSRGAQEILNLLPHEYVHPSQLKDLSNRRISNRKVYASVVTAEHMVIPNNPGKQFNKADYYAHPEDYHSTFHETIASFASVIVNCMYWEHRYPQLLTNNQLQDMFDKHASKCRLLGVCDITCDVEGSIECLKSTTCIEQPYFRYNPVTRSHHTDLDGEGLLFLAVDILPTEFAKEATAHFGNVLQPFISTMARCKNPMEAVSPLRRACIAHSGHLSQLFDYIQRIRNSEARLMNGTSTFTTKVSLSGHLFDKFLINEALDVIEAAGGKFQIATCQIGQTCDAISYAEIEVAAESEENLSRIVDALSTMATRSTGENHCSEKASVVSEYRNILILGAGRMCEPTLMYLTENAFEDYADTSKPPKQVFVHVGSLYLEDASKVVEGVENALAIQIDVMDEQQLESQVQKVEVVISLLPPSFHERVAVACIELKKHLVTASYVSKDMALLDSRAQAAGVTLLCEMGLDPGIDHMMAMKMIDASHERGGKVRVFESYCGGLPSPEAANNPLAYKFSWNPTGAIKAGRNAAIYKHENKIIRVPGERLFGAAVSFRIPQYPAYALEVLPNRDSLMYGDLYGITQEAATIFRGTLRYEGFGQIMDTLGKLGYYNSDNHPLLASSTETTYAAVLEALILQLSTSYNGLCAEELARIISSDNLDVAKRVLSCIRFLGLDSQEIVPRSCKSAFEVLCSRMEEKLVFRANEQDLVLLHHELEVVYEDSRSAERHSATLVAVGESCNQLKNESRRPHSAMARTVGLTVAIGAELLFTGRLKSRGVIRPLQPEVYVPGLEILGKLGLGVVENVV